MKVLVFNDTSVTGHYGCMAVMEAIDNGLRKAGMKPIGYWPTGVSWKSAKAEIERLKIDAIIVNGEGTIHSPKKYHRAAELLELASYAKHDLNIPIYLINASLFDIDDKFKSHLVNFSMVFTRERESYALCQSIGLSGEWLPDLSLLGFYQGGKNKNLTTDKNIVVTDSVLPEFSEILHCVGIRNKARAVSFYPNTVFKNIFRGFFVKVLSRLRQLLGGPPIIIKPNYSKKIKSSELAAPVKGASLFVTGRFHGVVMAIATKTDFLALQSNTPKIQATLRDVFYEETRLVSEQEIHEIVTSFKNDEVCLRLSTKEESKIDEYVGFAIRETPKMFAKIYQDIISA